jgi:hypothetical protein
MEEDYPMTRRLSLFGLLLVLALSLTAFATEGSVVPVQSVSSFAVPSIGNGHAQRSPLDEIVFEEHWESGDLHGWTTADLNVSKWHLDTHDAFGGTGTSWWMGDPELGDSGGYDDDVYYTLDSPSITLPAGTPTLKFFHRYKAEPAGVSGSFNGWDGMNLRISTDNGVTWNRVPTTALTPGYDRTSLYSFGWMHCEGINVPGWCSTTGTAGQAWHQQLANLSTWAGQTVKIRWAFASDPAFSSAQPDPNGDPTMFGWMVDNIRVYAGTDTVFTDDCNSETGWSAGVGFTSGGDLWRVGEDNTAPEGPHVLFCNVASSGQYRAKMNNAIISPYIDLRNVTPFGTINIDLQLRGNIAQGYLPGDNTNQSADFWAAEISADSGRHWCSLAYLTCDSTTQHYVTNGTEITDWMAYSEAWSVAWADWWPLHNSVVKIRFRLVSDCNTNVAEGMVFDDIVVTHVSGFPNDVACNSLQVRYPNVAGRPFKIRSYFSNPGQNDQNTVQGWWRVGTQTYRPYIGTFALPSSGTRTRDTLVTIASAGTYGMTSRVSIGTDDNRSNDTAKVFGIEVAPAGSLLEIGYDNHALDDTFYYFPNYPTGEGALVHFTPVADGVITRPTYSITNIKAQFSDQQMSDADLRVHIYLGGATAPGTEIYNAVHAVAVDETGSAVWKSFDVHGDPDTQNISGDFWVWFETIAPGSIPHYPAVLGVRSRPWSDLHYYDWTGTGNPSARDNFIHIHATLDEGSSVREIGGGALPTEWSLTQNFPNPFNPTTEIRYTVPRADRMTLKVYNLMGQEVATLVDGMVNAGTYAANFDGSKLASGVYVYRLESSNFSATHKMLLMK